MRTLHSAECTYRVKMTEFGVGNHDYFMTSSTRASVNWLSQASSALHETNRMRPTEHRERANQTSSVIGVLEETSLNMPMRRSAPTVKPCQRSVFGINRCTEDKPESTRAQRVNKAKQARPPSVISLHQREPCDHSAADSTRFLRTHAARIVITDQTFKHCSAKAQHGITVKP